MDIVDGVTKQCTKCKEIKALEDFPNRYDRKSGKESACRLCYNARKRKWSKTNRGKRAYKLNILRMVKKKRMAIEYLGGRCADCGEVFEDCVYGFHHLNPDEKESTISSMRTHSWENIKIELDKCVLLCANCHRIRHNTYDLYDSEEYLESVK